MTKAVKNRHMQLFRLRRLRDELQEAAAIATASTTIGQHDRAKDALTLATLLVQDMTSMVAEMSR